MATGLAVSVVCIPLALQVAMASPAELQRRADDEGAIAGEAAFEAAKATE